MRNFLFSFAVLSGIALSTQAHASPGFSFVCFDREMTATIDFDEAWQTAYMKNNWGEFELKPSEGQGGPEGSFAFEDSTYAFNGVAPEGQITRGGTVVARCYQSRQSIKDIALYTAETNGKWSKYNAKGKGFQTVRSTPSVFGEKLTSLDQDAPVTILENTDQFLDGFFWFKIEYAEGQQGYIWGALLCTNDDNSELNATLRRCY